MRLRVAAALVLAVVLALVLRSPPAAPPDAEDAAVPAVEISLDDDCLQGAPGRLAAALALPTLASRGAPKGIADPAPFQQMHKLLQKSFPLLFQRLRHERVNDYSLLFTWKGSNPELRPLLTMSHLDVVPAPTGPGYNWTHGPFSGAIADGFIWGRGALDIKSAAFQQLEAVALLLRQGYTPRRTLYFALGHDEEVGGDQGAAAIAALLRSRGVELEAVLDEGGLIMMDGLRGPNAMRVVDKPIALVGTGEKGWETWVIEVQGSGGHSSMPPVDGSSVAARIARILAAIEAQPTTTRLAPPTSDWLQALAPAVKWAPLRMLLQSADNWVVNPVLGQLMGQLSSDVAPFVRTTAAVVGVQAGGVADNVLPKVGTITVNFRVLPGQGGGFVREYLELVTRKEAAHVTLRQEGWLVAPPEVAPVGGKHWQLIKQVILETLRPPQGLVVAPYLVPGMTDSRWYAPLAGGRVYRFCPHRYGPSDVSRVHGVDERISVEDYLRGIRYYYRLLQLASSDEGTEEAAGEAAAPAGSDGGDGSGAAGEL